MNIKVKKFKKVLVLGSGALKIGQAGEFDFSGSQCLKALKEEGISTVLINPNIATIQTSPDLSDKIYYLPITPHFVEEVIKKEKVDGVFLSFGGQTALNCGLALEKAGVFKKYKVEVLGTSPKTIEITEDRDLFVKKLNEIDVKTPSSVAVKTTADGLKAVKKIGFPVMIRAAFALGGHGSGVAKNVLDVKNLLEKAFTHSPQVLLEEYLGGWKEIEYEVVRDKKDNCITVCNMENLDPLGIHTGESIVVAPSQTLNNHEYQKLRNIALKTIRHLGVVGECNIQYALDPKSDDYRVIEVNARLSRSSALASKATGYPLAFVAAKLGLGYVLTEIKNAVTKKTTACFEPALDYVVVKLPRWDLNKFKNVSQSIGSEMKSVGEVMAIGRSFEEALQKGVRMLEIGVSGITDDKYLNDINLKEAIKNPTDKRIFAIASALRKNISINLIHSWSKIDKWFLEKIKNIISVEAFLKKNKLDKDNLLLAKQNGFSDKQIAEAKNISADEVWQKRKKYNLRPFVKSIDTLSGEYPAQTNYLYLTYNGIEDDILFASKKSKVIVLGSGAYRIGSSVEFDWCCVNAVKTARKMGWETVMINYNPETVSTDFDECDKLYFDELSLESVLDIYSLEKADGVIVSMGGQIPNNLAHKLEKRGVKILGTSSSDIDRAEDRNQFSSLLDKLNIDQPDWQEVESIPKAKNFAEKVGYPVLIRPSYVLSGAAMNVVFDDKSLEKYLNLASDVSPEHPVVISKFIENAKEIEIDAVAQNGDIKVYAILEHIENAGVHSGDATIVLPPQKTYIETVRKIKKISKQIAEELNITGPFNMQFLAKENKIKVIECNLRSSRSFPFSSKVYKANFIEMAARAILGEQLEKINKSVMDLDYVGVKSPQFSFSRLKGADPITSVEMASTGEVGCFGDDLYEAFLKSVLSVGMNIPIKEKYVLITLADVNKHKKMIEVVDNLIKTGYKIISTKHTHAFFKNHNIESTLINKVHEKQKPNIAQYLLDKKIGLIISLPNGMSEQEKSDATLIRRLAVDYSIPLISNLQIAQIFSEALKEKTIKNLEIKDWLMYD